MDKNLRSKEQALVIRQEEIAKDVYSLWVKTKAAPVAAPGQFAVFYTGDDAHLLGRPISICEIDAADGSLRFVYQKKGFGTDLLSRKSSGDHVEILAPLGRGFPVMKDSTCLLIGGGMGIAPLLALAKELGNDTVCALGFKDAPFLAEQFLDAGCRVIIASENGMGGIKGNVLDAIRGEDISKLKIFACGPKPMLKAVVDHAAKHGAETFVSLEEKMACGIGACLGCVTPAKDANDHYRVKKLCICKDGPVFPATEVVL